MIIFLLVCGYPPFNGDSQERIFKKIKRGKFRFPKSSESGGVSLSESVKSLITGLLQMQPKDRLSAEDALKHPWICGDAAPDAPLPSAVVDALGAFRSKMRLKKAVARVLAHHMTEDDKENLAAVFKRFDADGNGNLGPEEIAEMVSAADLSLRGEAKGSAAQAGSGSRALPVDSISLILASLLSVSRCATSARKTAKVMPLV